MGSAHCFRPAWRVKWPMGPVAGVCRGGRRAEGSVAVGARALWIPFPAWPLPAWLARAEQKANGVNIVETRPSKQAGQVS